MAFFFPQAHADIDWARGYEMLDKELQPIVRQAKHGRRYVDKLVKVWLKSGEERWLLIHMEVQAWKEGDFPRRMYVYNHRIFDRYDREVISLAILADDDPDWRPSRYEYGRWGFRTGTEFPIVKLLDYARTIPGAGGRPEPVRRGGAGPPEGPGDAAVAGRPAGVEIAAGQGAVRARDGSGGRAPAVPVHRLGHGSAGATGTSASGKKSTRTSRRSVMPFIDIAERVGLGKGLLQGIEACLKMKFGAEGLKLMPELREIRDHELLDKVLDADQDGGQPGRPAPDLDPQAPVKKTGQARSPAVDRERGA